MFVAVAGYAVIDALKDIMDKWARGASWAKLGRRTNPIWPLAPAVRNAFSWCGGGAGHDQLSHDLFVDGYAWAWTRH